MPRPCASVLLALLPLGMSSSTGCDTNTVFGRKELQKIKVSLGRINDEVHAILGVLDDFDLETSNHFWFAYSLVDRGHVFRSEPLREVGCGAGIRSH